VLPSKGNASCKKVHTFEKPDDPMPGRRLMSCQNAESSVFAWSKKGKLCRLRKAEASAPTSSLRVVFVIGFGLQIISDYGQ